MIRVIPGATPCYECVVGGALERLGGFPEAQKGRIPYLGQGQEKEFVAEPGLGMDVRFIALIQSKMALLTLLRGSASTLEDFPADLVFWGNRTGFIFPEPLYAQFATASYRPESTACGEAARNGSATDR